MQQELFYFFIQIWWKSMACNLLLSYWLSVLCRSSCLGGKCAFLKFVEAFLQILLLHSSSMDRDSRHHCDCLISHHCAAYQQECATLAPLLWFPNLFSWWRVLLRETLVPSVDDNKHKALKPSMRRFCCFTWASKMSRGICVWSSLKIYIQKNSNISAETSFITL